MAETKKRTGVIVLEFLATLYAHDPDHAPLTADAVREQMLERKVCEEADVPGDSVRNALLRLYKRGDVMRTDVTSRKHGYKVDDATAQRVLASKPPEATSAKVLQKPKSDSLIDVLDDKQPAPELTHPLEDQEHCVVLTVVGVERISTIRYIREFTRAGLRETKLATENLPSILATFKNKAGADTLAGLLRDTFTHYAVGTTVEVRTKLSCLGLWNVDTCSALT